MRSVMTHMFSQIPNAEIQRSQFDRSSGWKGTFDAGFLIPFFIDEVLPGDTFNLQASTFARLATPIVPIMDNMYAETFFFFVPNRLVWDNWERFNGAQDDPGDSTDYTVPILDRSVGFVVGNGSLADYFGIQPGSYGVSSPGISALPFRAYNLIYNEWFRDENLVDSREVPRDDGPDDYLDYSPQYRGKRHDYFTSALPWPQKGDAVTISLGSSATVMRSPNAGSTTWYQSGTNTLVSNGATTGMSSGVLHGPSSQAMSMDPNGGLYADLASSTGPTINALREAFQIQRLLERDARGGTRYVEILLAHFGVVAPDFRLQRPEYLGGSSAKININPVAQTSSTDATTPQGNLAGYGTFSHGGQRNGFVKSFVEHGHIIGIISVRADLNYQTGLDRMWSRQTRYDFYWPALSHLGEQTILNKELYVAHGAADNQVFGYQERYAEYRYKRSVITGQFRSSYTTPLDMWHLAENFTAAPLLNANFIYDDAHVQVDRVIAVPSEPQFLCDAFFRTICARPMPTYSVPGFIDRF